MITIKKIIDQILRQENKEATISHVIITISNNNERKVTLSATADEKSFTNSKCVIVIHVTCIFIHNASAKPTTNDGYKFWNRSSALILMVVLDYGWIIPHGTR